MQDQIGTRESGGMKLLKDNPDESVPKWTDNWTPKDGKQFLKALSMGNLVTVMQNQGMLDKHGFTTLIRAAKEGDNTNKHIVSVNMCVVCVCVCVCVCVTVCVQGKLGEMLAPLKAEAGVTMNEFLIGKLTNALSALED